MKENELDPIAIIREEARAVALCFGVAIPDDAAASMVDRVQARLAGVTVYIPARSAQDRRRVHELILSQWGVGVTVNLLAQEHGLTPRSVRRIIAGARLHERVRRSSQDASTSC